MTVGNVLALRQTNIVRMLAYSSVSQGGFILMPLAVVGTGDGADSALKAVVFYLIVYAFTNLGVFAVVIAVARKTRSGEISSYGGLFSYAPGLATLMTIFLASLAGIPPFGGVRRSSTCSGRCSTPAGGPPLRWRWSAPSTR